MPCDRCSKPGVSGLCGPCEMDQAAESYFEHEQNHDPIGEDVDEQEDVERAEHVDASDPDMWVIDQEGLDGKTPTGQITIDGGVSKDGDSR